MSLGSVRVSIFYFTLTLKTWPKVGPSLTVYLMLQDHVAQPWGVSTSQLQARRANVTLEPLYSFGEGLCLSHLLHRDERSH